MRLHESLALALDPALLFSLRGWQADDWQCELLRSSKPRVLLNCSRQAGKSTTVAALACHTALFKPASLVLLLSRALRQSSELFRKVIEFLGAVGPFAGVKSQTALAVELANGSRIVSLPGLEETIRSFSGVRLLVIDEAARVPTALYKSVRPMLAVSGGRLVCLSTPFGRSGFFHDAWQDKSTDWQRFEVQAKQVGRISAEFLEEEKRTLGQAWFDQEYGCSFAGHEGLVYPELASCGVEAAPAPLEGRAVGGIDFGFRNPFAAVWGVLTRADVLWLVGEHYASRQPLHENAVHLPRKTHWYADPAGANEIASLRCGNLTIQKGENSLRAGIAAVTARIQTGRLKIVLAACPHLLDEAGRYRYAAPEESGGQSEQPVDEHNHALAALRYLVASLDHRFLVQFRRQAGSSDAGTTSL
jgi:hypothetical protein